MNKKRLTDFYLLFALLGCLHSACSTDSGKCKFGTPVAIFSDTMQRVEKHHFEIKDKTGIEFIAFNSGMLLEVEQSGCNSITQQYTFEMMGNFSKTDDAFWISMAVKNFDILATYSPQVMSLSAWAEAIGNVEDRLKLAEPLEVQSGIFVRIDKIIMDDRAMLVVQLSQS